MLKSEVATGRRMNGAEMCMFYPENSGFRSLIFRRIDSLIRRCIHILRGDQAALWFQKFSGCAQDRHFPQELHKHRMADF
jgi:hypothetical protein